MIGFTDVAVWAWVVTTAVRLVRARRLTVSSAACAAFLLVTVMDGDPRSGPGAQAGPLGLALDLSWVLALALTARWLLLGYYGTARPPWFRPLHVGAGCPAAVLGGAWLPLLYGRAVDRSAWLVARWWALHLIVLGLAGLILVLAVAGACTVRGRHRVRLLTAAAGGWLTGEAALLDLQTPATALSLGASSTTHLLVEVSLTLYWGAAGLSLLPRRGRRDDPRVAAGLEELWLWLAPAEPPLVIDERTDTGVWVSDAVITVRDRIGALQRCCAPTTLTQAERAGRRNGLSPRRARAMAVAECLWQARRAEQRGDPERSPHANLMVIGGGRWLDQELRWLLDVYNALELIAGHQPTQPARAQTRSPLADPELVARCQRRLEEWLPSPRPATMAATRAVIARRRGRRIGVIACDTLSTGALYAKVLDRDLLFLDKQAGPFMLTASEAHELGHLIWDHTPITLNADPHNQRHTRAEMLAATPDLSPELVLGVLGRCLGHQDWHNDPAEAEAEVTGRLIVRHLVHAPGVGLARYLDERR